LGGLWGVGVSFLRLRERVEVRWRRVQADEMCRAVYDWVWVDEVLGRSFGLVGSWWGVLRRGFCLVSRHHARIRCLC
jgi:hypothetical protein